MCIQLDLFEKLCIKCNSFIAEYGENCDRCEIEEASAMFLYCEKYKFKDYSDAVNKLGRDYVNETFRLYMLNNN